MAVVVAVALTAADASAQSASRSLRQSLTIELGTHLNTSDLRLTGRSASRAVVFELGRRWNPVPGSTLHLFVAHSPDLDPDRSFLSITMNYGIVRSLRLDQQNASRTEVVIPIPPELVKHENEILFALEQYPRHGRDANSLWTTIDSSSFVRIESVRTPARLDLAELPDSLMDAQSHVTRQLAVLLPDRPSAATLEATALLTANMLRKLGPGVADIQVVRSVRARAPVLIVGTPREQPQLALLQGMPFGLQTLKDGARLVLKSGTPLGDNDGIVGLAAAAGREGQPVLYVTGNSPAAVDRGARTVVDARTVSGTVARITDDLIRARRAVRAWKGFVPPRDSFTLADLEGTDLKISPYSDVPLTVSLDVPPDARFLSYGHRLNLRLKIEPAHFTPDARLQIHWNAVNIGEYRVAETFNGTVGSLPVSVPARVLASRNLLRLTWIDPGARASHAAAGWLLRDSEFYLPRYYQAELPDLALLQFHFYPFSLTPDFSDVLVVLPNRVNDGLFAALLELSAALARLAPDDRVAFRVKRVVDVTDQDLSHSHLVVLHTEESGAQLASLVPSRQPLLWAQSSKRRPAIQEMTSPWNADRFILVLSAASADDLRRAIVYGLSEPNLNRLAGDAAHLNAEGPTSFTLAPRQTLGEYSYLTSLEAWLRTNWLALPIILTVASSLFFLAFRLALRYPGALLGGPRKRDLPSNSRLVS